MADLVLMLHSGIVSFLASTTITLAKLPLLISWKNETQGFTISDSSQACSTCGNSKRNWQSFLIFRWIQTKAIPR